MTTSMAHAPLARHQRKWLREALAGVRSEMRPIDQTEPVRTAYLVADRAFDRFAVAFAHYAIEGKSDTQGFTLPILRVLDRYQRLCALAYLGPELVTR